MKKVLLAYFICIPFFLFSQTQLREKVHIQSPIFHIVYNEKLQQPTLIEYTVTCIDGKASRLKLGVKRNGKTYVNFKVLKKIKDEEHTDYSIVV